MSLHNFKEIEDLEIHCNEQLAGHLRRNKAGSEFEFSESFFEDTSTKGISFHLNKKNKFYKFNGDSLPAFFAGLLPEGLRLKAITNKIKTSEDDLFSILAAIGSQCVGDVYAKPVGNTGEKIKGVTKPVSFKDVDFYKLFLDNLEASSLNSNDEALAGVQEKISASMISFPLNVSKKDKSYILKLNPKDKLTLVENEFLSLALAKKCGLDVNKAKLVIDSNNQKGLLVERFDRYKDTKASDFKMLHQEDGCQFLNRYPADKYRVSFKEILKGIESYSTAPKIEILKALQLYAFSYLLGNGDLHAKNISLQTLKPSGRVVLTPCYDLICTYIYQDHKMALKLNGRDDNIKRRDFIELGHAFSVPEKAVVNMLDKLLTLFNKNYAPLMSCMNQKQQKLWLKVNNLRSKDLE